MPGIFSQPEGSALDNSFNIFIADADKDSIYKFNSFGDELQSFGGPETFNQLYGVDFFNKTLYVADTGNNRILRFILSTELQ
jgi:DNA-binding beta-propeller fold protein YncE